MIYHILFFKSILTFEILNYLKSLYKLEVLKKSLYLHTTNIPTKFEKMKHHIKKFQQ